MKGVVFNLLESFVCDGWGEDTYEEILALCPLHTREPFVGPGTYPDADLFTIATKVAERLGLPLPDALHAFGVYCFPRLAEKVPGLVAKHGSAQDFLRSLDEVVHVEVRKLLPNAQTPSFGFVDLEPNVMLWRYGSRRKLCHFMRGLMQGVGAHFGVQISCEETRCMHAGADECEFVLRFGPVAA